MNKGLDALERLYCAGNLQLDYVCSNKHKEDYDTIEKELKALEIIKDKQVNIKLFFETIELEGNAEMYNKYVHRQEWRYLTQEEYNLLKEVLL